MSHSIVHSLIFGFVGIFFLNACEARFSFESSPGNSKRVEEIISVATSKKSELQKLTEKTRRIPVICFGTLPDDECVKFLENIATDRDIVESIKKIVSEGIIIYVDPYIGMNKDKISISYYGHVLISNKATTAEIRTFLGLKSK